MTQRVIIWKVEPAPTGRYRSFSVRGWPSAFFKNGEPAVMLRCANEYDPRVVRTGEHAEIEVWVAQYYGETFSWRKLKKTAANLRAAKELAAAFFAASPKFIRGEVAR